ncbi:hypothetical protein B0T18DRAFT_253543 [Schizothecium vesticola]|uniref:PNPLA domain-containing protein n=1 Tax=Schizothecium vesticola TaxID=314040 RepID=A0AA40EHU0_9PEZI|nr:hypothetical protein B0T18DRAFT_253543 [Schizothecium vesticola]
MLGRLGMGVQQCIDEYCILSSRIFAGKYPVCRVLSEALSLLGISRFDKDVLQSKVQDLVRHRLGTNDEKLCSSSAIDCKVFVCTTRVETASATLLRSYRSLDDDGLDCTIWEAARATSAAPTYFDPAEFGNPPGKYCDGGMRNNNPINHAFWETHAIWGRDANIGCILSIGTGAPSVTSIGIFGHQIARACIKIATQTEQTAADFIRNHQHQYPVNRSYFRFNVPHGLEEIQLDEWQHLDRIDACTRDYVNDPLVSPSLEKCAEALACPSNQADPSSTVAEVIPPSPSTQSTHSTAPIASGVESQPSPLPRYMYVSMRISPFFTDREAIVVQLWAHFWRPNRGHSLEFSAVVGLGGIGKTQIALRYISQYKSSYWGVFFIESSTIAELNVAFRRIATLVIQEEMRQHPNLTFEGAAQPLGFSGLVSNKPETEKTENSEQVVWAVKNWLQRMSEHRFLLVFDSANDPEGANIAPYIPNDANADIIVTSRHRGILKLAESALGIDLQTFDEDAALKLIAKPARLTLTPQQVVTAKQLFKAVGKLPLVIDQIGCYIATRHLDIEEVARTYERHAKKYLQNPAMFGIGSSAWATCETTYEWALQSAPVSASLLFLLSFVCQSDICSYLYNPSRQCRGVKEDDEDVRQNKWIVTQIESGFSTMTQYWIVDRDPFILQDAFGKLVSISLVRRSTEAASFVIHPVVHAWARMRLSEAEQAIYARDAVLFVARALPSLESSASAKHWEIHRRLLPHMDACYRNARQIIWELPHKADDDAFLRALEILATSYFLQGHYGAAEDIFSRVLGGASERSLQQGDTRVLNAKDYLAAICDRQGDLRKGEQLYKEILAAREKSLGMTDPLTLKTVSDLAGIYDYEGRVQEAKNFYLRALEGLEAHAEVGPDDPRTSSVRAELGSFYDHQGLLEEAEKLLRQALNDRESKLGKDDPDTLSSVMKLAGLYMHNRNLGQAEALYERALQSRSMLLGSRHPKTLQAQHSLAGVYFNSNRILEARKVYESVLQDRREVLGFDHPDTLWTLNALGGLLVHQGELETAKEYLEEAKRGLESRLGLKAPDTLWVTHNLGIVYETLGEVEEAEQLHQTAVSGYTSLFGKEDPSTFYCMNDLAACYERSNKLEEAEKLFLEVHNIKVKKLGQGHPDTLYTDNCLAGVLWGLMKLDEAEKRFSETLRLMRQRPPDPDFAWALSDFGDFLAARGEFNRAESLYEECLQIRSRTLPPDFPDVVSIKGKIKDLQQARSSLHMTTSPGPKTAPHTYCFCCRRRREEHH